MVFCAYIDVGVLLWSFYKRPLGEKAGPTQLSDLNKFHVLKNCDVKRYFDRLRLASQQGVRCNLGHNSAPGRVTTRLRIRIDAVCQRVGHTH